MAVAGLVQPTLAVDKVVAIPNVLGMRMTNSSWEGVATASREQLTSYEQSICNQPSQLSLDKATEIRSEQPICAKGNLLQAAGNS